MTTTGTASKRGLIGSLAKALFVLWNVVVLGGGVAVGLDAPTKVDLVLFAGAVLAIWAIGALPLGILSYVTRGRDDTATVAALEEQNRLLREIVATGQPIGASAGVAPGGGTRYGRSYRLQSDGSVEARRPDGVIEHFHSMDEFEARCR